MNKTRIKDIVNCSDYVENGIVDIEDAIGVLQRLNRGGRFNFTLEVLKKEKKSYEEELDKFYKTNISEINCDYGLEIMKLIK